MKRLALLLPLVALLAVGGCGKGNFSQKASQGKENVFRYPIVTNPTSLDPGVVRDGDTIDLLQQVYEGLVGWGPDNKPTGLLAENWDVKEDNKTYVFHLRKGVKFHSGREFKAEDFKWTIERNTTPGFNSEAKNYLGEIVGLADKVDGKAKEVAGVRVIDDYTVEIEIDKPRPYFIGKLTYIGSAVIDKDAIKGDEDQEIGSVAQMVGTGPFKASEYVPEQITVLDAFQDYWGGAPKVAKIERPVIKDAATRLNKYKLGEIDLVMLERMDVESLQNDAKLKNELKFFPRPATWYVGCNEGAYPPFKNLKVKQAFAMAIDKEAIVNDILGGVNTIANSIVPPGIIGHRPDAPAHKFNPEQAKKLLAEAGYPGGKGLPPLDIYFREQRPDIKIAAERVASDLKEHLGVTVGLKQKEWRAFLDAEQKGELPFVHMRWGADYLDPENFLSFMLASYGPQNHLGYSNPEFDRLCREADTTMDEATRLKLYAQAEDIALRECPWIPIYFQRDAELISPRVQGMRESLFGHLPHTTVEMKN